MSNSNQSTLRRRASKVLNRIGIGSRRRSSQPAAPASSETPPRRTLEFPFRSSSAGHGPVASGRSGRQPRQERARRRRSRHTRVHHGMQGRKTRKQGCR